MFALDATKTGKGTRTIILPGSIVELLRQRKKRAVSRWIFPNPTSPKLPMSPASAYQRLKVLLKQAGLPDIRFRDLRHTFATRAPASGVDAKTLSGVLGHTNASFTLDTYVTKGIGTSISFERAGKPVEAFDSPGAENIIELNGLKSELHICTKKAECP